jgi:hypothetical protein
MLLLLLSIPAAAEPLNLTVFPGAEGFGTSTPAGRGGQIVKVVSLADAGPGSLRAALAVPGPRVIVFEVGGAIRLHSDLQIRSPYVTVAGQSAPRPGITLVGAGLSIQTHDVLIEHLRIRVGDLPDGPPPQSRDGVNIIGPGAHHVVLDHLSASWAIDENGSTWFEVADVTISNCIFSEGLHHSKHNKGPHSKGFLVGDKAGYISLARNLFAHNADRNPFLKGGVTAVVVNNLMYNSGTEKFIEIADDYNAGPTAVSIVGNRFIGGMDTPANACLLKVHKTAKAGSRVFLLDNSYAGDHCRFDTDFDPRVSTPPVWDWRSGVVPAVDVEELVLSRAGARPVERDQVDLRVVADVRRRTGKIIDSQAQVGGWANLPATYRPFVCPGDPNGDPDGNGYTRIEECLHRMSAAVETGI